MSYTRRLVPLGSARGVRITGNSSGWVVQLTDTDADPADTPPPHDQLPPRSILSRRTMDDDIENQIGSNGPERPQDEEQVVRPRQKPRKRVMLLDPKTELPDEVLKVGFHGHGSCTSSYFIVLLVS
jgi:hypothetical protein